MKQSRSPVPFHTPTLPLRTPGVPVWGVKDPPYWKIYRPTIQRKTQQGGPVRSRKGRGRNDGPYIIVLEAKREEFEDDALIYAKSLCEELEISFEPPRRIWKKHIFGDGSKDVPILYENDLRRTMFSSIDRATAEI
ncbi:uncharacterized protein TNCV_1582921 [Trichonephila clavipes]|nr:uncharacterized protein TNCV_1582921 [Trichonephila clavipes]